MTYARRGLYRLCIASCAGLCERAVAGSGCISHGVPSSMPAACRAVVQKPVQIRVQEIQRPSGMRLVRGVSRRSCAEHASHRTTTTLKSVNQRTTDAYFAQHALISHNGACFRAMGAGGASLREGANGAHARACLPGIPSPVWRRSTQSDLRSTACASVLPPSRLMRPFRQEFTLRCAARHSLDAASFSPRIQLELVSNFGLSARDIRSGPV